MPVVWLMVMYICTIRNLKEYLLQLAEPWQDLLSIMDVISSLYVVLKLKHQQANMTAAALDFLHMMR